MSQAISSPSSCCSPCSETVNVAVPGPQGEPGADGTNGTNGTDSFTTLTSPFTQPATNATDDAVVANSSWVVIGQILYLEGGGYYQATAIPDATHITIKNLSYTGNAVAGTVIAASSQIGPGGIKGTDGASGGGDMLYAQNLNAMGDNDTSLQNLGGTDVGLGFFKMASPGAVTFPRINADNTVTARSAADFRTDLSLVPGTNIQVYDAFLTSIAALGTAANKMIYTTGVDTAAEADITAVARTLLSQATAVLQRSALGVIAANLALYEHQQASGVDGGDFNNGAWRTVPINTEVTDVDNIGTLAANEVTLIAGTYRFKGWANAYSVTNAQMRLWNNTSAAVVAYGRCAISAGASTQLLLVEGRFTIGVASAIRLEAQCSVSEPADGFGKALGFGGTEVYGGLEFIKE